MDNDNKDFFQNNDHCDEKDVNRDNKKASEVHISTNGEDSDDRNTELSNNYKSEETAVKKGSKEIPYSETVPHINSRFAKIAIAVFMSILILPMVSWGVLKAVNLIDSRVMEKLDFDTGEQRKKADFPKKFNPNTVTAEIESYFNDRVPYRSVIITAQNKLSGFIEKPYTEYIRPVLIKWFYSDKGTSADGTETDIGTKPGMGDLFGGDETEPEESTEIETVPIFDPGEDETSDPNCVHEMDDGVIEREPTCLEWGILRKTCKKCGSIKREYTQKSGHNDKEISRVLGALCTDERGLVTYECIVCHRTRVENLPARGHDGVYKGHVNPSVDDYGYDLYECKNCGTMYRDNISAKKAETSYLPQDIRNGNTIIGRRNWLFYNGNNSVGYYQGTNILSDNEMAEYVAVMTQLQALCDKKGIQLQFMLMPNKEIVYGEYMPSYEVVNSYRRNQVLTDYIRKNSNVNIIYPYEEMLVAKQYWQLYYKHDTHWNEAGAFIGAQALYRALGMSTTNLLNIPVYEYNREVGDLISLGGLDSSGYRTDTGYTIDYPSEYRVVSSVGDRHGSGTLHTKSNNVNGKKLVMIGDSFRLSMIPYLEVDFSECTITHRDKIISDNDRDPNVVNAVKNADVLVISAVERYDASLIDTARKCIDILSQ